MPGPWSRTVSVWPARVISTRPAAPLNLAALSSRLAIARWSRSGTATIRVGAMSAVNSTRGQCSRARSTTCSASAFQSSSSKAAAGSSPRASSTVSATRPVRSSIPSRTEEISRSRSSGSSSSILRSTSTLVRREVSGVRSSCEASATSWRCRSVESCTALSMALKLTASRPSSSRSARSPGSMRCARSRVAATRSAASVSWPIGRSAVRVTHQPRPPASRIPASPAANSSRPSWPSWSSAAPNGSATSSAVPLASGATTMRTSAPWKLIVRRCSRAVPAATARSVEVTGSSAVCSEFASGLPVARTIWT